jgi:type II secretion system protein D
MKIIADKNTNSIIIKALPSDYKNIKAIIQTLDATPQQVLIEAIIAEVTLQDTLSKGVEVFFRYGGPSASGKPKGAVASLLPTGVTSGDTGVLPGGIRTFTFNRDIDAIFNLVATETESEILSTPHILVRDEQTASIQVGQSEPIRSGSTTGSGGVTTAQIEYRDTGTILTITPRIGENQMLTLDIVQELSSAVLSSASDIDSPTFPIRKTETSLVVKSGHAIYLGGIINVKNETIHKKMPFLGSIPYLGRLFKSDEITKKRTELMVLITPHIINTSGDADRLTRDFRDKLQQIADMQKREKKASARKRQKREKREKMEKS